MKNDVTDLAALKRPADDQQKPATEILWLIALYAIGTGYLLVYFPDPFALGPVTGRFPGAAFGIALLLAGGVATASATGVLASVPRRSVLAGSCAALVAAAIAMAWVGIPLGLRPGAFVVVGALGLIGAAVGMLHRTASVRGPTELVTGAVVVATTIATLTGQRAPEPLGSYLAAAVIPHVVIGIALLIPLRGKVRLASAATAIAALTALAVPMIEASATAAAVLVVAAAGALAYRVLGASVPRILAGAAVLVTVAQVAADARAAGSPWAASHAWDIAAALAALTLLLAPQRLRGRAGIAVALSGVAAVAIDVLTGGEIVRHLLEATLIVTTFVALSSASRGSLAGWLATAISGAVLVSVAVMDVFAALMGTHVHLVLGGVEFDGEVGLVWGLIGAAMTAMAAVPLFRSSIARRSVSAAVFVGVGLASVMLVVSALHQGIGMVAETDQPRVMAFAVAGRDALLGIYLITLVVIATSVVRSVLAPLSLITRTLERYRAGDTAARIAFRSTDELGRIASTIDGIADDMATMDGHRRDAEQRVRDSALRDDLTGLPSRALIRDRASQLAAAALRSGEPFALLLIDLDEFKTVNDTFGHDVGDDLLVEVAGRLAAAVRPSDTAARLAGDEFAVLLPGATADDALGVADRFRAALAQDIVVRSYPLHAAASVGVAVSPEHGSDPSDLWRRADIAMYAAKREEQGALVFDPRMDETSPERLTLLGELRSGIERGEIVLHYQPQIDLRSGRLAGVEALVRWQHPRRGLLQPGDFVPLAEKNGVIAALDVAVLQQAARQAAAWAARGIDVQVSANMSAKVLAQPRIGSIVEGILRASPVPRGRLTIEITEESLIADMERAQANIARLRGLGIRLSVDDFGAGQASFAYVRDLAVDELKIDQSFVRSMRDQKDDATIVRAIVALGHDLGRHVVAEGVEDASTLAMLRDFGCDVAQGYHTGRPMPVEALDVLLAAEGLRPVPSAADRPSVLVVEDAPSVRRLLSGIVERDGFEVGAAGTVAEAKAELLRRRFDVALLDVNLPDGLGIDVARWLALNEPKTQVAFITGFDPANLPKDVARYAVVQKPFAPEAVRSALRSLVAA